MEVTTESSSLISHTKGDDLCEIDVTNVAIHSVTLLICLCGLAGNGALFCLLGMNDICHIIFDMAVADFLFLLFTVPSTLLFLVEDVSCSTIVPPVYLSFLFQLSMVSYYWGLFQLTYLNVRKDMTFLFQLCCRCQVPERLWWLVWRAQYWAFFTAIAVIPAVTFLCPSHEQEHCRVPLISSYAIILLLFAAPVVTSSTMDIIKAKWGSQQQQPKRRDIVIVLIALFALLLNLCNFLHQLGYTIVPSRVFFLLTCVHCGLKPFIYFLAGRCWRPCSMESLRLSLQRVFEERKHNTAHRKDSTTDTFV